MKITRTTMKQFRKSFAEAVKDLEAQYDVSIKLGNIGMRPHSYFTSKITVKNNIIDGVDFQEATFKNEAIMFGFIGSDYKRKLKLQGETYELIGFNRKARKNDCTIATLDGKNQYVTTSATVKSCFI
jgi:hypothetical protein